MGIVKTTKSQFSILRKGRPRYVLYGGIGVLLVVIGWLIARTGRIEGVEAQIFRLLNNLPQGLGQLFLLVTLFGAIGMFWLLSIVLIFTRRYAYAIQLFLASMFAWFGVKLIKGLGIRERPYEILQNVNVIDFKDAAFGYPSGHMAVATAAALVIGQRLSPAARRWLYVAVFFVGISRVVVGMHAPIDIMGGFGVGLIAGSLINFLLGTPSRRFLPADISRALKAAGFNAANIKSAKVDARGSAPYFGEIDGVPVFIKIVDSDNTIADWLFKFSRRILYRRLEDEIPFFNAKRQLEHEALLAMLARESGIKTPRIIGICHIAGASWALIQEGLSGASLDKLDPDTITDDQLKSVWQLVSKLHQNRIAHRDLRTANILRDDNGELWLIDFGFSEISPGKQGHMRDTVEMLASMSCLVGSERAVAASRSVLSRVQLARLLPYVQYSVLSGATTSIIKSQPNGLNDLRNAIHAETHQKAPATIARIKRINIRAALYMVILLLLMIAVVPRIGELKNGISALADANMRWILVAATGAILTYFAASFTYTVLARVPLSYFKTLAVQIAASFANRLIPSGVGGLSLNVDYLFKNGHKAAEAASVTAANSVAAFVSYVLLLVCALTVSKTSPTQLFAGKSVPVWIIIIVISLVVAVAAILWNRKKLRSKIKKLLLDAWVNILEYRHEPFRIILAVVGAALVTIFYVTALFASAHAIGLDVTPLQAFVAYTIGMLIGAAVPTPGGLGGVDAGLYAGLIAFNFDPGLAFTAVLIYRMMTFWLPILPGYISFWALQRKKII